LVPKKQSLTRGGKPKEHAITWSEGEEERGAEEGGTKGRGLKSDGL